MINHPATRLLFVVACFVFSFLWCVLFPIFLGSMARGNTLFFACGLGRTRVAFVKELDKNTLLFRPFSGPGVYV